MVIICKCCFTAYYAALDMTDLMSHLKHSRAWLEFRHLFSLVRKVEVIKIHPMEMKKICTGFYTNLVVEIFHSGLMCCIGRLKGFNCKVKFKLTAPHQISMIN